MRRTFWTYILMISSFIACPCHLPLTLPLLLSLFSGTALGAFLAAHTTWIVAFCIGYFIAAVALVLWRLKQPARPICSPQALPSRGTVVEAAVESQVGNQ